MPAGRIETFRHQFAGAVIIYQGTLWDFHHTFKARVWNFITADEYRRCLRARPIKKLCVIEFDIVPVCIFIGDIAVDYRASRNFKRHVILAGRFQLLTPLQDL